MDKKTVVLIFPKSTSGSKKGPFWEPLSLLALARILIPQGYKPYILDHRIENNIEDKISSVIDSTICIAISSRSDQVPNSLQLSSIIKKNHPQIPIIWGGWHATTYFEQTINNPWIDFVVRGQGEQTMLELTRAIESHSNQYKTILGISYKNNGAIIHNPERPLIDINDLPPMLYDLTNKDYLLPSGTLYYFSSFGCGHNCSFCGIHLVYHHKWFGLSPDRVIEDIRRITKKNRLHRILFFDDNFFSDHKRAQEICKRMIENNFGINWSAQARISDIMNFDDDFLKNIRDAGCDKLLIGIESGSQKMLGNSNKIFDINAAISTIKRLHSFNIKCSCNFIIGLPNENEEDFQKTIELIKKIHRVHKKTSLYLCSFFPIPRTTIYKQLVREGKITPANNMNESIRALQKINYGDSPWLLPNDSLGRPMKAFYLYYGLSRGIAVPRLTAAYYYILRAICTFRVMHNIYTFPAEWWLYKSIFSLKNHLSKNKLFLEPPRL